jgi:hypothetical protein
MANWQDELESLLASIDVALEPVEPELQRKDDALDRYLLAHPAQSEPSAPHGVEVGAVWSEVEATVRQVSDLVRSGSIDSALREDVAFVLRALARPGSVARGAEEPRHGASGADWDLESAAAILRFCRIVLRLAHVRRQLG